MKIVSISVNNRPGIVLSCFAKKINPIELRCSHCYNKKESKLTKKESNKLSKRKRRKDLFN